MQQIAALITADARVKGPLGQPIEIVADSIDGSINLHGRDGGVGSAALHFELRGPLGNADVDVGATRTDSRWQIDTLNVNR